MAGVEDDNEWYVSYTNICGDIASFLFLKYSMIDSLENNINVFRVTDLETALLEECSATDIYCICKGKPLPENLRAEVWQVGFSLGLCLH